MNAVADRVGGDLLEREAELNALAGALDSASTGNGRLVLLSGEPGIGKSSLLAAMAVMATRREVAVARARGAELEREIPFGIALQLLERRVAALGERGRERVLRGAARLALPLLESGPAPQEQSLLHGLYWLAANLAESRPLALLVDDAQWADRSSLLWLNYLAQRIEDLPIVLVVAYRAREPGAETELLGALASNAPARTLEVGRLSNDAIGRVVRGRHPDAEAAFCDACAQATEGNPFLLREVLGAVATRRIQPVASEADTVAELAPAAVMRAVLDRVDRLGEGATDLVRAAAVLGPDAPLRHAAALAGLDIAAAAESADRLAWADVLRAGDPLEFAHPLLRSVVYADIPPARRARLHGYAARLLADEAAQPGRVAVHLVNTPGARSPWVVGVLEAAAGRALAEGAPKEAALFLRRALGEPPEPERRREVVLALAAAQAAAGDPEAAEHYAEALAQTQAPDERVRVAAALARVLAGHGRATDAAAVLDHALAELSPGRDDLALALQATWVAVSRSNVAMRAEAPARVQIVVGAGAHDPSYEERMMLAEVAGELVFAGEPRDEAVRLARLALGDGRLLALETSDGSSWVSALAALGWSDELDEYERGFGDGLTDAVSRGSVLAFATCSYGLNFSRYYTGRLADAVADARQALDAERYGWREYMVACRAQLAWSLIERDELAEAEAALAPLDAEPAWQSHPAYAFAVQARGRIALARGDNARALELLLDAGRRIEAAQIPNPAVLPWASLAAAAAAASDPEQARELAARELAAARRFGAPRAIGIALRGAAIAAGGADAVDLLREAGAALADSAAALERTRVLVDLGAALRANGAKVDARAPLREALDHAHRMGAFALERRARTELVATGARPRRAVTTGIEALTPSERRVAAMAAGGMTNREIAEALFVTVKAVQWHLGHVYRKLGITGREGLPVELTERGN